VCRYSENHCLIGKVSQKPPAKPPSYSAQPGIQRAISGRALSAIAAVLFGIRARDEDGAKLRQLADPESLICDRDTNLRVELNDTV
jgi:hypothetical protein